MKQLQVCLLLSIAFFYSCAQPPVQDYIKLERMIPMRDGTKLYTAIYAPADKTEKYPILMVRTPYSCAPYGEANLRRRLGPNLLFEHEKYIYVYQDVRGRYMSEGSFEEMTPAIADKKSNKDVDESTDAYDTIEWLLSNTSNNGRVGIYGISYPGFYATASLPNAHPAIKAVSPQAPVTDEFEGDDAYHRGAFFLMDNFGFMNYFDHPRTQPWKNYPAVNDTLNIEDAYAFYLSTGALKNFNTRYFNNKSKIWNEYLAHDTKDNYWQARDIRKHLTGITPATLVVGGWFDAEDLFGALETYRAIERQNPQSNNKLVMGPWTHGAWAAKEWSSFDSYTFGSNTSATYHQLELEFFNYHLKQKGNFSAGEATIFITGSNQWKTFDQWPPKTITTQQWMFSNNHQLLLQKGTTTGADTYVSDPANPVPYMNKVAGDRLSEYMAADQSFASKRGDVLYFETAPLEKDITVCGPLTANLTVSMTGTDADFIVKLIDIHPDGTQLQQLVRAEVLRGKFRNSFEKPEPFVPNQPTQVKLTLNDAAHTFLKGHRIMVQVQSSWFPLVDRNPQQFMHIPAANDNDYKQASITLLHNDAHPSYLEVAILP